MNQNPSIFTSPRNSPGFFGIPRKPGGPGGFSVGSNDLTQLTWGLDRDSGDRLGASSECHGSYAGWVPGQRYMA